MGHLLQLFRNRNAKRMTFGGVAGGLSVTSKAFIAANGLGDASMKASIQLKHVVSAKGGASGGAAAGCEAW